MCQLLYSNSYRLLSSRWYHGFPSQIHDNPWLTSVVVHWPIGVRMDRSVLADQVERSLEKVLVIYTNSLISILEQMLQSKSWVDTDAASTYSKYWLILVYQAIDA